MQVASIMSRQIVSIGPDEDIAAVRRLFDSTSFHHVLVIEGRHLRGVVSDRDLLKAISPFVGTLSERTQDAATLKKKVHQVMNRTLVTIRKDELVPEAAKRMLDRDVSCLPVVNASGEPEGIITFRDVLRWVGRFAQPPA